MASQIAQLECLTGKNQAMLDQVIQLCDINSGTGNVDGIEAVSRILVEWFGELGGDFNKIELPLLKSINSHGDIDEQFLGHALQFVKRPEVRPRVLLCIHMDTVYGPHHRFQKCEMLDDGRLNGPGVADAKGGLVLMLHTLQALEASDLAGRIGWEVIINPDEEFGSPTSNEFLRARAREADWGMLFEPTLPDGTLVSWRKGVGNFIFVVRGVSAHAGRAFDEGSNAIVALSRLLNSIHELNSESEIIYNVGRVEGGGPLNMVPDLAIGRVNVRIKTLAHQEIVTQNFERLKKEIESTDGFSVELYGSFTSPPKELDQRSQQLQSRIEKCGRELGLEIKWRGTGGASDGNKFSAAGLANIDTFGPRGGDIHSGDEYLIVESLEERAKLATLVLLDIAASA